MLSSSKATSLLTVLIHYARPRHKILSHSSALTICLAYSAPPTHTRFLSLQSPNTTRGPLILIATSPAAPLLLLRTSSPLPHALQREPQRKPQREQDRPRSKARSEETGRAMMTGCKLDAAPRVSTPSADAGRCLLLAPYTVPFPYPTQPQSLTTSSTQPHARFHLRHIVHRRRTRSPFHLLDAIPQRISSSAQQQWPQGDVERLAAPRKRT